MLVKSEIARPEINEVVAAGTNYRVRGGAWSSESEITKVELSTDNGASWDVVRLGGDSKPNAWRLWDFDWNVPNEPGTYALIARATDSRGRVQPEKRDGGGGTYMVNHYLPVEVEVR
jgi:hypothetical protein